MADLMKAVVLARFGGVDAFELHDVSVPHVEPRQVRVRVHATAVNPLDYQIRRGDYADLVPLPAIIGHDISGVIEEVGSHVTEFRAGDAVYYTPRIFGGPGSYAEQHVTDVDLVGRKPENLSHLEAASLTLVGGTVWEALVTRAQLTVGETILVHGGTGGVGTIAIQVAKAIGAQVITTAKAGDHGFVRSLGADEAVDYAATDYVDAVAELTRGKGVDVVFDTIGGDTLTRSPLTLADSGRVVSIVDIAQPQNLIEAWGRNAAYHFVFTRQNRGKLDALTTLVERGLVRPVIGATLPLTRMGEAHELLENRRSYALRGKVAIDVAGETVALPPRISQRNGLGNSQGSEVGGNG
ncbi:zinc-dependent alcohol dehydrogenase family protein [Mycolicibacterium austroafricanum]|uniref:zinc-dependent alcohol dehydrogenase family protein n=1 Tax=Mycolicibacterium austroafricanum TaxID=39687 RepID=UPI001CA35441|nr:zinc-dependent alcohol dehydrogenase family protein [Mycolicibacterium austroafricanum]QZT64075.1 zinc-dependent alcohol dehydrogenase family protein [Mycolicibacterium austroafricanum]